MWSKTWFLDTSERVIASFAGTLLTALWGPSLVDLLPSLNVLTVDWKSALGLAGGAALLSLLKALVASKIGDPASASLVRGVAPVGRHERR